MRTAPRTTPRIKRRFKSTEEELTAFHDVTPALFAALRKARRAIDSLMPGIDKIAVPADEIANINAACIEGDRAIAQAERVGVGDGA